MLENYGLKMTRYNQKKPTDYCKGLYNLTLQRKFAGFKQSKKNNNKRLKQDDGVYIQNSGTPIQICIQIL
ncbi:hypothetical protein D3C87_786380 [compost metagenome]